MARLSTDSSSTTTPPTLRRSTRFRELFRGGASRSTPDIGSTTESADTPPRVSDTPKTGFAKVGLYPSERFPSGESEGLTDDGKEQKGKEKEIGVVSKLETSIEVPEVENADRTAATEIAYEVIQGDEHQRMKRLHEKSKALIDLLAVAKEGSEHAMADVNLTTPYARTEEAEGDAATVRPAKYYASSSPLAVTLDTKSSDTGEKFPGQAYANAMFATEDIKPRYVNKPPLWMIGPVRISDQERVATIYQAVHYTYAAAFIVAALIGPKTFIMMLWRVGILLNIYAWARQQLGWNGRDLVLAPVLEDFRPAVVAAFRAIIKALRRENLP